MKLSFEIKRTLNLILENPYLFRGRRNHRRANLKRFPYYIPFIIRENDIFIIAFAHNARKPDYWKQRLA